MMINASKQSRRKRLYAIAYERHVNQEVYPCIEYLHAFNARRARVQFMKGFNFNEIRVIKVVGVAPVVGFHVHDEHGEKLSV